VVRSQGFEYTALVLQLPFRKLEVWQKSMTLVKKVYAVTRQFPQEELYSLTNQIRRSAISIPSNIAEGSQRTTNADFRHFLSIAKGSLAELETQLILASDLQYIDEATSDKLLSLADEIGKMIYSLKNNLIPDS